MRKLCLLPALFLSLSAFACGGEQETPKTGDDATAEGSASATVSAESAKPGSDMGEPPATSEPVASSAPTAAPTAAPIPDGPALDFKGLKVTITEKGAKKIEVADDGTVKAEGKPVFKFVKNTIQDETGKVIVAVAQDGSLSGQVNKKVAFNDKDQLVFAEGGTMTLGKDGKMTAEKDKKSETLPVKFTGVTDKNRRAAALMGMMMMMMSAEPSASPPQATTEKTPSKTTPPAPKPASPKK